jgi:hypothetical protein
MIRLPGLWIGGDTRAELYDPEPHPTMGEPRWAWNADTAAGLPDPRRGWFGAVDEVKPVLLDAEPCVIVTSSGAGGAALIRRSDRAVLFCAPAVNAHSIEVLPGGWLVITASTGCDAMLLYHVSDGVEATEPRLVEPLAEGHGAVWDRRRGVVWTCGAGVVRALRLDLDAERPRCETAAEIALPEAGAHDLQPDPCDGGLIVTTGRRVWRLDPETQAVVPFEPLARIASVKAVSVEARSGAIAFQKGECGQWWSHNVYVLTRMGHLQMRTLWGRHLYKVRWDQPCSLA